MPQKNNYLEITKMQVCKAIEMWMDKQLEYTVKTNCIDIRQMDNETFEIRFEPFSREKKNDGNGKEVIHQSGQRALSKTEITE
jgi:hypothetical protein